MYSFDYHRPQVVDEAVRLRTGAEDATYLAGGQTLIPTLKQRLASPSDVVDLAHVAGLRGIEVTVDRVVIGAMTTHAEVAASAQIQKSIPALAALAGGIGDGQVRNRGTIGGSVAKATLRPIIRPP